jgi:hypothetical protein
MVKVYATEPRYALLALGPLLVFSGMTLGIRLANWPRAGQATAAAAMIVAVGAGSWLYVRKHQALGGQTRAVRILAAVQARQLDGKRLLVSQTDVPLLHYYFPLIHLTLYRDDSEKRHALSTGGIDAVISAEDPVRIE